MYDESTFTTNFRRLITEKGYTQKDLAEKLGTNESTLSKYVNGTRIPPLGMLVKIARLFALTLDDLAGYESPHKAKTAEDQILFDCYRRAAMPDRCVLWALLDRYMSPEERAFILAAQSNGNK